MLESKTNNPIKQSYQYNEYYPGIFYWNPVNYDDEIIECWEEDGRCNDCPVDYPYKQCEEYKQDNNRRG